MANLARVFVVREDTGDVPRSQLEAQAIFLNSMLAGTTEPEAVIDRQGVINWNLIEFVDQTSE